VTHGARHHCYRLQPYQGYHRTLPAPLSTSPFVLRLLESEAASLCHGPGILYLVMVALFTMGRSVRNAINAAIRTLVFLWVAAVIAYLSGAVSGKRAAVPGDL